MKKKTKSEKTRNHIIREAAVLFNQKGFAGTSMQDIMDATGLTKGGIYGNFKKGGQDKKGVKNEIALAAFRYAVGEVGREVRQRTQVIEDSVDKLKAVVYYYKESVLNPAVSGGCPILNTSIEADDNHPELRALVVKEIQYWHQGIIKIMERGMKNGEIRQEVDPDEFATLFIGMLEGGIMLSRIQRDPKPFGVLANQLSKIVEGIRQ